ncbi:MAG: hypothetical protein JNM85_05410 [Chthonomonas sp.]|nr:hypothetical protein [Chthonomonas sp.]
MASFWTLAGGVFAFANSVSTDVQPSESPMFSRYEVASTQRLALTPQIDGRFDQEEWDGLNTSVNAPTTMQWEPNKLFLGAVVPVGRDIIFSLDLNGDGWLVGDDNVELRVSWGDGAPIVRARRMDAMNRSMPLWIEQPFLEGMIRSAGIQEGDRWTLEMAVPAVSEQPFVLGRTLGIRSDDVARDQPSPEAFMPRSCTLVFLRYERGRNIPGGIEWASEYKARTVVPGEAIKVRMTMRRTGGTEINRAEMRTEGLAAAFTKRVELPFPAFDRKGRSFIDYETSVAPDATRGFRILRTTLKSSGLEDAVLQTSYRISDIVDFEVTLPNGLVTEKDSRVLKGNVILRSNTLRRVDGVFTVGVPDDWSVARNREKKFIIYHSRGTAKIPIDLIAPQNARGVIPIAFRAQIGDRTVSSTTYLVIR